MGKYANIQLVKEGKIFFLTIIFKNLFRIDLPKSAGGIFFFTYSLITFGFWSERDKAAFNIINHLNHVRLYIYTYILRWKCTATRRAHELWGLQWVLCLKWIFLFNFSPPISTLWTTRASSLRCAGFVSYCFYLFGMTVFFLFGKCNVSRLFLYIRSYV